MSARLSTLMGILAVLAVPDTLIPPIAVNRWRYVHAARARTLRRRGENVKFHCYSPNGRAIYKWRPAYAWEVA